MADAGDSSSNDQLQFQSSECNTEELLEFARTFLDEDEIASLTTEPTSSSETVTDHFEAPSNKRKFDETRDEVCEKINRLLSERLMH